MSDLSRRAVACKGWRWMPRMVDTTGRTFVEYADCGEAVWLCAADDGCEWMPVEGRLPNLTDPATIGCVLALVCDAWGDEYIYCASSPNIHRQRWYRVVMGDDIIGSGRTERAALVAALEAAP
jgi:hypothetical protein